MIENHKTKSAGLFFLVAFVFISCNNSTHPAEFAQQPGTYQDMGRLIIEKIKNGDYDELSGAWPDKVKYQVWSDYCHHGDEMDWEKMTANGTSFREHTSRRLKELLKGVPDKNHIVFKATHFYDRDKCREKFRSAGMLEIEFNIFNTTYALYCSSAVETIDGKVYLLDELLLNRPN